MKSASLLISAALLAGLCWNCSPSKSAKPLTSPYFNLRGYFEQQIKVLQQTQPIILKTVNKNNQEEQKNIRIDHWERELALFSSSDINKADWLQSYQIDSSERVLSYTSLDPDLRTKRIRIEKSGDKKITHIRIENGERNWLYSSTEDLDYYPDSLYVVHKYQKIRFLGAHHYLVKGAW